MTHTHTYECIRKHIHTYTPSKLVFNSGLRSTLIGDRSPGSILATYNTYTYMHTHTYIRMHTDIYIHTYTYNTYLLRCSCPSYSLLDLYPAYATEKKESERYNERETREIDTRKRDTIKRDKRESKKREREERETHTRERDNKKKMNRQTTKRGTERETKSVVMFIC